jgi:hypothetical protein
MEDAPPDPAWERRHPEGPESWSFDFASPDGGLGGFVGLTLWARPRLACTGPPWWAGGGPTCWSGT